MKADEPRQNRIPFMMSDAELEAVDEWRFANKIATRAEAIRRLCQIALAIDDPAEKAADLATQVVRISNSDESGRSLNTVLLEMTAPMLELSAQAKFIRNAKNALRAGESLEEAELLLRAAEKEREKTLQLVERFVKGGQL